MLNGDLMAAPPFVFGRIADSEHFIDREDERTRLRGNFDSLVNTVIISPRRWGKSSLVRQVATDIKSQKTNLRVCLIDLFNVRSEADFYAQLATGVMRATMSKWEEWIETAGKFLSHLRPKVTIAPDLTQEISLEVDWHQAEVDPNQVLDLAEKIAAAKKIHLVVCIDEFQAIAGFTDSLAFQRKLRSHWQGHQNVCYCLYGSKRHMLLDVFSHPDKPFYRFADTMILGKIDNAIWGDFIKDRFASTGKLITNEQARRIANLVDNHSYYVQQLAQQVWFRTEPTCTDEAIETAMADLVDQLGLLFTGLASSLSARQLSLLRAILDGQTNLSAQSTLKTYNLGTSASIVQLKSALVNREIIDVQGKDIEILDPVFGHWLRTVYFRTYIQ